MHRLAKTKKKICDDLEVKPEFAFLENWSGKYFDLKIFEVKDLTAILAGTLRILRSMGYKRSSIPPEQGNDCVEYRFDLFLDNDIDKPHQSWLTVTFYLSGDEDSVCQYVEVGKKEVPVMELRCGGKPVDLVNEEEVSAS